MKNDFNHINREDSMSIWHELKDDDIDIDWDQKEINICYKSENQGNWYCTMTWNQLNELYHRINKDNLAAIPEPDDAKKWQHEETGYITECEKSPGPRWYEI